MAKFDIRDTDRQQPMRVIDQRGGHLSGRGAFEIGLYENNVPGTRITQCLAVEGAHSGGVQDRYIQITSCLENRIERGPTETTVASLPSRTKWNRPGVMGMGVGLAASVSLT